MTNQHLLAAALARLAEHAARQDKDLMMALQRELSRGQVQAQDIERSDSDDQQRSDQDDERDGVPVRAGADPSVPSHTRGGGDPGQDGDA